MRTRLSILTVLTSKLFRSFCIQKFQPQNLFEIFDLNVLRFVSRFSIFRDWLIQNRLSLHNIADYYLYFSRQVEHKLKKSAVRFNEVDTLIFEVIEQYECYK